MNSAAYSVPVDRASVDFSADRRRFDGTRSFWATSNAAGATRLRRWNLVGDGWAVTAESYSASWLGAVSSDAELIAVRADEVTDYQAPDSPRLLELLVPAGDADRIEVDWPFDMHEFEIEDDDFGILEGAIHRYARIGGKRLYFAESDGQPLPFLVEGGGVDGDQIATFSWGTEVGMTWGFGGWDLFGVSPGTAVAVPTGDMASESMAAVRGFRFDATPAGTARMIAAWLSHAEYYWGGMKGCTALALEPLDPFGLLTDAHRAAWQDELDRLDGNSGETCSIVYFLSSAVKDELRRSFSVEGSTYTTIKEALADPIQGDWLRQSLADGDRQPLW